MNFDRLFLFLFLFGCLSLSAQETDKSIYLKGNAVFLPIGMLNVGAEFQLNDRYTLQSDIFISPWKSFAGRHAQVYMGHLEGRYYFNEAFRKWFVGVNGGFGVFDITKWNYVGTEKYQRGFTFMMGATVGYQFQIKENWNIDLFLGAGTAQSYYHGYEFIPPDYFTRYEYDGRKWNRSGEFLPYRGGVMIAYKIK